MNLIKNILFILLVHISVISTLNAQINRTVLIIDSKSKEIVNGATIYSFLQGNCISNSDKNGVLNVNIINPIDTIFQIQAIGYNHKKITKIELENSSKIALNKMSVPLKIGSATYLLLDYENFYRKCNKINIRGYYNKYLNGRWHSNSNINVNNKIIQGRVINIKDSILVEEIYHYNSYLTYNKFKYSVINDTIKGKLVESISTSSKYRKIENCKTIYEEIIIPICELREDCTFFFNYPYNNFGYKKTNQPIVTWDDILQKVNQFKPNITKIFGGSNSKTIQRIEGCWDFKVDDYCQNIVASYCFKNDSLITYKNEACRGGTSALYKYKIVNDTIVAEELETYRNIEGFISQHYVNRMIKIKIPFCWFIKENSCFASNNPLFYYKGKIEFNKIIDFKWVVAGKVLENGKWIIYNKKKQNQINTDENKQ